jgi:hypothetical protein
MKELSNFKKGDTTPLEVLRNGEIKTFSVTF